jgi:hypothetical protein
MAVFGRTGPLPRPAELDGLTPTFEEHGSVPDVTVVRPPVSVAKVGGVYYWQVGTLAVPDWRVVGLGTSRTVVTIANTSTDTVSVVFDATRRLRIVGRLRNRENTWQDCYGTFNATDKASDLYATRGYVDGHLGVPSGEEQAEANGTEWQWAASFFYSGAGPSGRMGYGHLALTSGMFLGRCAPSVDLVFDGTLDARVGRNRFLGVQAHSGKAGVFQPSYFFGQNLTSMWADDSTAVTSMTVRFKFSQGDTLEYWSE